MENQAYSLNNAGFYPTAKTAYPGKEQVTELHSASQTDKAKNSISAEIQKSINDVRIETAIDYLDKIEAAEAVLNIATDVNGYISDAAYYAKRNNKSQAFSMLQQASSKIQSGLNTFGLKSYSARLAVMESLVASANQQIASIESTDEELLQLTGVDSKGNDLKNHILNKIGDLSLSTTPRSTFESLLSMLNATTGNTANIQSMLDEISNKKPASSNSIISGNGLLYDFNINNQKPDSGFAGSNLTQSSSDQEGSIILKA